MRTVYRSEVHKSKKERVCHECKKKIKMGDYYALTGEYDKQIDVCDNCFKIINLEDST